MALLRCDKCQTPLPGAVANTRTPVACPACQSTIILQVFPAFLRPALRGRTSEPLASQEDAGCFYHPHKKAVVPCEECGRFLCALCDLEIDGRHGCPACLEISRQAGKGLRTDSQRTLHDQVALNVALVGLIMGVGFVTGPVGLFLVVRYWNEPKRSPVPRSRSRLVVAGLLSLLLTAVWSFLLYARLYHPSWLR